MQLTLLKQQSTFCSECESIIQCLSGSPSLSNLMIIIFLQYFETDDPDLFETKIKYILENDVSDLDMDFTEEEFDSVSHEVWK